MTSTTNTKKKLIEVAIPLEAINAASAREKSIRHGHPSTLHLWWARRPLAACRAVLFAQLVDDPSSDPEKFPTHEAQEAERKRLFGIIEELVKWENSTNEEVLERARAEIRKSCGGELPPIYDPFSGGGSIPLEAQRLGLPAYGSDLNPVAVTIGKAMIEIPARFAGRDPVHPSIKDRNHYRNAESLAEDVRYYGQRLHDDAWTKVGRLYPKTELSKAQGGGSATVVAWIWARTVASPDPAFRGAHVPLISSFILGSKKGRETIVAPIISRETGTYTFKVKNSDISDDELNAASNGTKAGKAQDFICLLSNTPVTRDYIRNEGKAGRLGARLMAVVCEGKNGRIYCDPTDDMQRLAKSAGSYDEVGVARDTFLAGSTPTRAMITGGVCSAYGLSTWGHLFSDRQIFTLSTFGELLDALRSEVRRDAIGAGYADDPTPLRDGGSGALAYAEAISVYLAFAINRSADRGSTLCTWDSSPKMEALRNTFGRQAIPMTWDFAEGNPFSSASGNFISNVEWVTKVIEKLVPAAEGAERQMDAQTVLYPAGVVISTDPPYYDNIGYADLSDFFFSWMKRSIRSVFPESFGVMATPKAEELVATQYRHGTREAADRFFLEGMRDAIANMARQSSPDFPATIYYAFKQSEVSQEGISSTGWATFLQAVVEAGYAVVGTWPLRTEMASRMIASGTNALANSVVLVCRKKDAVAEVVSRAEFIRALKRELPTAIGELQAANIAPADMPQSAIGPGMGVFSRYRAVLESDDSPMSVKTALQLINRELDEYLGGIQGEFDADTRFAITWFEQNGLKAGDYGTANSIATARGISVESVKHAGIVDSAAGKVRILSRDELDSDWNPEDDHHLTVWECLQHLVRAHEKDGISHDTSVLLKKINTHAEAVKDLAYCLYDISANKRKDAKEATAYNALIADWTELTKAAAAIQDTSGDRQIRLDI
jgi:putative DNA methylase